MIVITAATFVRIGTLLFGSRWRAPMARALDVSERTVMNYARGRPLGTAIPRSKREKIATLVERRVADLALISTNLSGNPETKRTKGAR